MKAEISPFEPAGPVRVILGLGANLGNPASNLLAAFDALASKVLSPGTAQLSSLYVTEPQDVKQQPEFVNAACSGMFSGSAFDLLEAAAGIEQSLGRNRSRELRRGPRQIDIDILSFGGFIIRYGEESDGERRWLRVPHERLTQRRFALVPLLELSPDLTDPVTGRPYAEAEAKLKGQGIYTFDTVSYIKSHGGKTPG